MESTYTNPANPGSYGGVRALATATSGRYEEAREYLATKDSYTLHRKKIRKFRRNKYILRGIDDLWQSDLADVTKFAASNGGVKYLLVIIDCFSKYLWVKTLTSKTSNIVTASIRRFLNSTKRKPKNWQVDKGGEFRNALLEKLMKEYSINFYSINNPDTKAAFAERVIRTLKDRIYRYLTEKNTWKYVDALSDLVLSYNNSRHRTIGMKPVDVSTSDIPKIKRRMYPSLKNVRIRFKFKIGDLVRMTKEKRSFEKGYEQGWTEEIFTIDKRIPRDPPVYKVTDSTNQPIEGSFYAQELQKVAPRQAYKVEKILGTRKKHGKIEYLIKWLGYPDSANSWEPESNLEPI